jgi:hypothetical protein
LHTGLGHIKSKRIANQLSSLAGTALQLEPVDSVLSASRKPRKHVYILPEPSKIFPCRIR